MSSAARSGTTEIIVAMAETNTKIQNNVKYFFGLIIKGGSTGSGRFGGLPPEKWKPRLADWTFRAWRHYSCLLEKQEGKKKQCLVLDSGAKVVILGSSIIILAPCTFELFWSSTKFSLVTTTLGSIRVYECHGCIIWLCTQDRNVMHGSNFRAAKKRTVREETCIVVWALGRC